MPRKPTGRPRGRPHGARQYRSDDQLCLLMAKMVQSGCSKEQAAKQLAPRADGINTTERSKAKRLLRTYTRREDWFHLQANARPTLTPKSLHSLLGISPALRDAIVSQQRLSRIADTLSPAREFARHIEAQQRFFERFAQTVRINVTPGAI